MLKIISFDMDGTLVSSKYVEKVWLEGMPFLYAERYGLDLEAAKKLVFDEYMSVGSGALEWYDLPLWLKHFDISAEPQSLLDRYRDQMEVYPEVEGVLQMLSKKFDLVVASNGAREFVDLELNGLKHYFVRTFSTTSDFKKVKNCPDAYIDMCDNLQVEPHEVLHIGDHRNYDYEIALEAGLQALYLDREGMEIGSHVVRDLQEAAERILSR